VIAEAKKTAHGLLAHAPFLFESNLACWGPCLFYGSWIARIIDAESGSGLCY
jgi:hypothetical protein